MPFLKTASAAAVVAVALAQTYPTPASVEAAYADATTVAPEQVYTTGAADVDVVSTPEAEAGEYSATDATEAPAAKEYSSTDATEAPAAPVTYGDNETPASPAPVAPEDDYAPSCPQYALGEMCIGAEGYEAVPWCGGCEGDLQCSGPAGEAGYGKTCAPKSDVCYAVGERCMGAKGKVYVPYGNGCCEKGSECVEEAEGWGMKCSAAGYAGKEPVVEEPVVEEAPVDGYAPTAEPAVTQSGNESGATSTAAAYEETGEVEEVEAEVVTGADKPVEAEADAAVDDDEPVAAEDTEATAYDEEPAAEAEATEEPSY